VSLHALTKENRDGVVEFAHAAKVCCHIERVFSRQPSAPSWRLSKPRPSCRGCWTLNDGRAARGLPPLDVQLTPLGSPQTKLERAVEAVGPEMRAGDRVRLGYPYLLRGKTLS
jgi:hypothetical protein